MNTAFQVLLTALLVGGGIGGYHLLTAEEAAVPLSSDDPSHERRIAALEDRLEAIEERGPLLQGAVDTQALWEQLQRLSERMEAVENAAPATGMRVSADLTEAPGEERDAPSADGRVVAEGGEPSPLSQAEEKRVRELLDGAMRDRMMGWANRRIDQALSELGIELTKDQREKMNTALGDHMRSVRDTFRQAREDGIPREERATLLEPLNQQLTETLSEFMAINDAEAVTKALPAMGRGPGGRGGSRPR